MTTKDAAPQIPAHYVYLYRDPETKAIRYIGKGRNQRVESHLRGSHNPELRKWVARLKAAPIVEIVPCESESESFAVEAALISALWKGRGTKGDGLFNEVRGHHGRFAPLGLPAILADRRYQAPLTRTDLSQIGGALVVIVGTKDFEDDGRFGAKPRLALSSNEVRERISQWWQVGRHVPEWSDDPDAAPRLLVGVTGPPRGRWIWGSCWINHKKWGSPEQGLWQVPVAGLSVDAAKLRGRLVAPGEVGPVGPPGSRRFGGITAQFFDVIARTDGNFSAAHAA